MKIVLTMILFSSTLFAKDCQELARQYGDGIHLHDLAKECYSDIKSMVKPISGFQGEVQLFGYENMLFVEFSDPKKYQARPSEKILSIAGKQLGFEHFEDGLILEKKKKLLILSDGKLSLFRLNRGGNIAPIYSLESEKLKDAQSIVETEEGYLKIKYRGTDYPRYFEFKNKKIRYLGE